jgi:hypothetical protein
MIESQMRNVIDFFLLTRIMFSSISNLSNIFFKTSKQLIFHYINTRSVEKFNLNPNNIKDNIGSIITLFQHDIYFSQNKPSLEGISLLIVNAETTQNTLKHFHEGYIFKTKIMHDYVVQKCCNHHCNCGKVVWKTGDDIYVDITFESISSPSFSPVIYSVYNYSNGTKIYGSWCPRK